VTQSKIWMMTMLLIMAVVCSSALALVSIITSPVIDKNFEISKMKTILGVFNVSFDEKNDNSVMEIYKKRIAENDRNGLSVYTDSETGAEAVLMSGGGFQGNIEVVVALNGTTISGFKVVKQVETPGLGARISEDDFQKSFVGKEVSKGIKMVNSGNAGKSEFDAITGATETSRALEKIINQGLDSFYKK